MVFLCTVVLEDKIEGNFTCVENRKKQNGSWHEQALTINYRLSSMLITEENSTSLSQRPEKLSTYSSRCWVEELRPLSSSKHWSHILPVFNPCSRLQPITWLDLLVSFELLKVYACFTKRTCLLRINVRQERLYKVNRRAYCTNVYFPLHHSIFVRRNVWKTMPHDKLYVNNNFMLYYDILRGLFSLP